MVILLLASALAEVLLFTVRLLWPARRPFVVLLAGVTAFASAALFVWWPNVMSALLLVLGLYRIFNHVRVLEARMHERYLRRATQRTACMLIGAQAVAALAWWLWHAAALATHPLWTVLGLLQALVAAVLLAATARSLHRTLPLPVKKAYSDASLPSITVAIPARNETGDLEECLRSIIASDYPKLEVIVLDDCSQTKRTPEIIRSFAHDGVRFVQGAEPSDTWLPKNQAYQRLAQEASGEYVLFCGVDIRFQPQALRKLVTTLLARRKNMVSVLPQRDASAQATSAIVQSMRYWWELAPPRRMFARPPVMSSCWIISRAALKKVGGFEAVTRSIVPEAYFARQLIRQDGYSFIRSDDILGVTTVKNPAEQRATAIRTRYPQLHRRPELVLLTALFEAGVLLLPYVLAVGGFWWTIGAAAHILAAVGAALLSITYLLIARATNMSNAWLRPVIFPLVVFVDLGLLHYSMWQYEFSAVEWKGRNVCIPAMHVVPHLPKI